MQFAVLTLFPEMFSAVREHGVIGRALNAGLASLELVNPRDFTTDKHRTVDDRPYGGGPGMVMKAQPLSDALSEAKRRIGGSHKVVYLTPQGRRVGQNDIVAAAQTAGLILVAGRYEGVDERFIDAEVDEEWSIGDYVVSGGELPAMLMIDAIVRQLPGALGDDESAQQDSFMVASAGIDGGNNKGNAMLGLLDCPHYTRPEAVDGASVPAVLLSGDHAGIARWREMQQIGRTVSRRPDLLPRDGLNEKQRKLLAEFDAEEAEKAGRE